jgi:peroxiredoxin
MMFQLMLVALGLSWLAILVGGCLCWQLLQQSGRTLLRLDELEKRLDELEFGDGEQPAGLLVGSEAPVFELPDLAGETRSLAQHRGQPLLLIFFNPACGFCREMLPRLAALAGRAECPPRPIRERTAETIPSLLIVSTGSAEGNGSLFAENTVACPVLLQKESEVAAAYQANGTPTGYLIDPEGKIASQLAVGAEALLALAFGDVSRAPALSRKRTAQNGEAQPAPNGNGREHRLGNGSLTRSKIKRDGLKAGTLAPGFRLPRLDGRGDLGLADLRGRRILLVFSSPKCGPCLALAPQLEKFHREHPELEVVMISKGETKPNRIKVKEHGLTFPVVLQQQWEISRRYAMFATPIAYLIDEAGVIVNDVAVGTDSILDLIARAETLLQNARGVVAPA